TAGPRIDLLLARAGQNECDVVVKGTLGSVQRGAVRVAGTSNLFKTDRGADRLLTAAQVRSLATTSGQELTYTCVPPGSGIRIGIDRDQDGCLDFDDADPTNPAVCSAVTTTTATTSSTTSTTTPPTTTTTAPPTTTTTATATTTTTTTATTAPPTTTTRSS